MKPSHGYLKQFHKGEGKKNKTIAEDIRGDFPILSKNLIWFDNGATTQKPNAVIDGMARYMREYNSNVHRSPHHLAKMSTEMFDETRRLVHRFLNSQSEKEIVFVRGTTEGMNFLTNTIGIQKFMYGGTVLLTNMEHHANIVPWQLLQKKCPMRIDYITYGPDGHLDLGEFEKKLEADPSIRIVSMTHVSNVLGTINPIKEVAKIVHAHNAILIVDGAQGVPHVRVDVQDLDCDFYVFSAHKLFGPTGVGAVYGRERILKDLPPWQGGGSMIRDVGPYHSVFQDHPLRFEAGTPSIVEVMGLGDTIRYIDGLDWDRVEKWEHELMVYGLDRLRTIPGIRILADTERNRVPIFSFVIEGVDPDQLLETLDRNGIAIRYGHHCAQLTVRSAGYESVFRASLAPYNTMQEIDVFVDLIKRKIEN